MAKYKAQATADSGAFQEFVEEIIEMDMIAQNGNVETYELVTTMDVNHRLDLSEGVISYTELCEACGSELEKDDYMETDSGSVCLRCQVDAMGHEEPLTVSQAALLSGLSDRGIRKAIDNDLLKAIKFGRDWMIVRGDLDDWMKNRRAEHRPERGADRAQQC